MIFMGILMVPFNYFFAHFAFNNVINKFVQAKLPKGQQLAFDSSFHFYPEPFVRFKDIDFSDGTGNHLLVNKLEAILDFWPLIKTKQLLISSFHVATVRIKLTEVSFDELIKNAMFPLIREGLGVPKDPSVAFPGQFSMQNVQLIRLMGENNIQTYTIKNMVYDTNAKTYMNMCFENESKAHVFYDRFLKKYLFAAKPNKACISFVKSSSAIQLPTLPEMKTK